VREICRTLADSWLLHWFCGLEEFGTSAPSKSAINQMRGLVDAEKITALGRRPLLPPRPWLLYTIIES